MKFKNSFPIHLIILALIGLATCQSDSNSFQRQDLEKRKNLVEQNKTAYMKQQQDLEEKENLWVEQQFKQLSEDQRLGQLFMIGAYPTQGLSGQQHVLKMIKQHHLGGLIFFRGGANQIARQSNIYQAASKVPLLFSIDAEWGISMRVDSAVRYPRQLLMGAVQDHSLIYDFGQQVAKECKAIGMHINFAPVVDVNNNPNNPVIGDRSFGEDRMNVTAKAFHYMKGMQDNQIMACAKHFPGHGDTDVDSHKDLPVILHNRKRLEEIELYPFRQLVQQGIQSVMVAHLQIPAMDTTPKLPVTLSPKVVQQLLKDSMNFKGLIFTDALNMRGVTKHFADGETDVRALIAGNDVLLVSQDIPMAKKKIRLAIKNGRLSWEDINQRVKKILRAKYRLGLNNYKPINSQKVIETINTPKARELKEKIVRNAITLVKDEAKMVPFQSRDNLKVATLSLGYSSTSPFQRSLSRYGLNKHFQAAASISPSRVKDFTKYDMVIVAVHRLKKLAKDRFGVSANTEQFIKQLSKKTKVMLVAFGTPYSIKYFEGCQGITVAYNNEQLSQELTAQALMGASSIRGRLPVSASDKLRCGMGLDRQPHLLEQSSDPALLGFNPTTLKGIDLIAQEMIQSKAAPGCQVLVAKNGKIAYHKTFGHHTYSRKRKVSTDDIYDLASVTKICATTISLMKLSEEGKIDLDKPLSHYLPELRSTNKAKITIRNILLHRAGLKPWIPFYTKTLNTNKYPDAKFYSKTGNEIFNTQVDHNLFFKGSLIDSMIFQRIYNIPQRSKTDYRYSDLGFILFTKLIKKVTKMSLDEYVAKTFYQPMGLQYIGFNPHKEFPLSKMIPTEKDQYFRHQVVQGHVHDMAAAMLGGVAGHAGLFARAQDLAVVLQMLCNGGIYADKRYLKAETIKKWTAQYAQNSRRGIGFDRKEKGEGTVNVAWQASDLTFGHTGFTGIGVWVDPKYQLVYIFLSNRTFPSGENMKLIRKDIRSRIQEVVYQAFLNK